MYSNHARIDTKPPTQIAVDIQYDYTIQNGSHGSKYKAINIAHTYVGQSETHLIAHTMCLIHVVHSMDN